MDFISVLNQALVLFILLIIGFIAKKTKIMTDAFGKGLADVVIYITLPALIITSMHYSFSKDMLNNSITLIIIGLLVYVLAIVLSILFLKIYHIEDASKKGVYQFLIIFGNVGFMGYPIVKVIYGDIGFFYAAIYNVWFNLFLWTLGVILSDPKQKKIQIKAFINPGIISVVIGFTLFLFSIKLPKPIFNALDILGDSTIPMAMLLVGSLLGDAKFKEIFVNVKLMVISVIRLAILPLLVLIILWGFDLPPMVKGIPVIIAGMPSAANAAIFSRRNGGDYRLASQGVFLTTALSVITIPLLMLLVTKMG